MESGSKNNIIKRHKVLVIIICFILVSATTLYVLFYPRYTYNLKIEDGKVSSLEPGLDEFHSDYVSKLKFTDMEISEESNVKLYILGKEVKSKTLLKAQRYYFNLDEVCNTLECKVNSKSGALIIKLRDGQEIKLNNDSYEKGNIKKSLRGNILSIDGDNYVSISDIEDIFSLIAEFHEKGKTIDLINYKSEKTTQKLTEDNEKIAFIRFEDFTCGDTNSNSDNHIKIKCMANLLYENNIKFHVGWIPRFVAPLDNIDNDLLTNNDFVNVSFVNVLDFFLNKGGEIGLHGYTHQSGDERSAVGEDLDDKNNNTTEEAKEIVEKGIDTASALNIPISFYESPHYRSTKIQKEVIEKYFKYCYEPYNNINFKLFSPNKTNVYIPTPLGFVSDPSDEDVLNGLDSSNFIYEKLKSFFYHPSIELDFIECNENNNSLDVKYDDNSPLKRIVKKLKDNKYITLHITDIN